MSRARIATLLLLVLLLPACSTIRVGSNFDLTAFVQKIQRGSTTQEQIRAWLGAPTITGVSVASDGSQLDEWTYYYATGRLPDMASPQMKLLQIKFDKHGVVQVYNWSSSR